MGREREVMHEGDIFPKNVIKGGFYDGCHACIGEEVPCLLSLFPRSAIPCQHTGLLDISICMLTYF